MEEGASGERWLCVLGYTAAGNPWQDFPTTVQMPKYKAAMGPSALTPNVWPQVILLSG